MTTQNQTRSQKRAAANRAAAQTSTTTNETPVRAEANEMAKLRAELAEANRLLDECRPKCGCGCQTRTKGGRFVPGHDAKLHSARLLAERGPKPVKVSKSQPVCDVFGMVAA